MQRKLSRPDLLEEIKFLRTAHIPFKFLINNHTYKVVSDYGKYMTTDNKIPMKELSFVKIVKDYVLNNNIHKRIRNPYPKKRGGGYVHTGIKYFDYRMPKRNVTHKNDLYEIDINAAYWETAYKIGIINEDIYKRGFNIRKNTRLAALGSLAKRTIIWEYDGKIMTYNDTIHKPTEHLWFKICEHLGNTMYKAKNKCGNDFIFYWVDGIYVRGLHAAGKVVESFANDGYKCKVRKVNSIQFDLKKGDLIVDDNWEPQPRVFPLTEPKFKYFLKQQRRRKQIRQNGLPKKKLKKMK